MDVQADLQMEISLITCATSTHLHVDQPAIAPDKVLFFIQLKIVDIFS